jgi:restriction modification system DNA specificity domain protein
MEYRKLKTLAKYPTGKLNSNAAVEDGKYPFFTCAHDIYRIDQYSYDGEYVLLGGNNASGDFPIFYYNGKFDAYQRTYLIQPLSKDTDTKYLYYSIGLKLHQMKANASGTATKFLTQPILNNINIEYRDIEEQKRIANILSTYDNLIENNNKRIKLLEQMAENLYKEWFVRFRFPGYEDVEFENGLPKDWKYTKLERLANISTGKCNREDAEEDGAYPLFDRSQEIKRSNVWLKDCEAIIVPGEGTSFIPRYYNGKFNLHQRCYCVEPLEKGMGFFLYQTLMMYRIYFLYVATGATVPSLRLNNFNDFKVLLPKKELCSQYNEIAEKMNDEILLLKNKNELLAKQRDMLLPRLMSGKLEV